MFYDTTNTLLSSIVEKKNGKQNKFENETSNSIHEMISFNNTENIYKTQCFPLYSILLAIEKTEIDYFGLDVEGSEYKILNTIPWQKVNIKVVILIFFYIALFFRTFCIGLKSTRWIFFILT